MSEQVCYPICQLWCGLTFFCQRLSLQFRSNSLPAMFGLHLSVWSSSPGAMGGQWGAWPALWVTSARPGRACWVKKTLYYSNISYYLFTLAQRKSGDLSPPGCARRVNLKGGGVKLRAFAERWSNGVTKFYWQALFNDWHWLNIFKPSDIK